MLNLHAVGAFKSPSPKSETVKVLIVYIVDAKYGRKNLS